MPLNPWERQPKESEEAYAAFLAYRDMGVKRTVAAIGKGDGKRTGFQRRCEGWSAKWRWVDRAREWDNRVQGTRDKVTLAEQAKWERRRLRMLDNNWRNARRLQALIRKMSEFPIEQDVTEDGAEIRMVAPAKWTFDTLAKLVKTAAEVEAATINEALPRGDDAFDPDTATPEECQAFLARQAGRGTPRT